uniref:NADH dehydrogenase [ubiquinone] 1 alpha subcomplex subunit 11 n=1 Tax=Laticauda laticaudata TaxID=8630 RepID=A0A8C5STP9_LATLA
QKLHNYFQLTAPVSCVITLVIVYRPKIPLGFLLFLFHWTWLFSFSFCFFPSIATLGAVFGASSSISAEFRDAPEDPMNYFIGGCASGVMIGARTNSVLIGTSSCIGLGALGAFSKFAKQQDWRFLVHPQK